ncbi:hypothetical protein CLAIMM_06755 [Cladophialophora immunda]|nr:hypothetical protein CLAIMM_06755 [Cladophialophora immunda]
MQLLLRHSIASQFLHQMRSSLEDFVIQVGVIPLESQRSGKVREIWIQAQRWQTSLQVINLHLVGLFSSRPESLDQYRENVVIESKTKLDEVERELIGSLQELTVDIETHFRGLAAVEEPLQRPFAAEALTEVPPKTDTDLSSNDEILLKDRILEFRALREEKEEVLCKLWNEWEDIQFDLIKLAVEALGKQSVLVAQLQDGAMKPGQQERLENTLDSAQKIHDEVHHGHAQLEQDMTGFEETIGQIANRTKKRPPTCSKYALFLLSRSPPG